MWSGDKDFWSRPWKVNDLLKALITIILTYFYISIATVHIQQTHIHIVLGGTLCFVKSRELIVTLNSNHGMNVGDEAT